MGLNYWWYRFKYRHGKHMPLRVPVDISLELSSRCNMSCKYCYHADPKNLPFEIGFMPKETAFKIIRQAAEAGVSSIKFNWKGESTLNPHYGEIVKYAWTLSQISGAFIDRLANSNFKIYPARRDEILESMATLTKVKVSYDSFRKEVFEQQRAGGNHDLTTENIDLFYNHPARIRSGTRLVIQAVRTKLNAEEDIEGSLRKRWPSAELSIRDMVAGRVNKDVSNLEHRARDHSDRQSCLQAHVRLIFSDEGIAYPCCPDIGEKLAIGSIHHMHLKDIFNSQAARELRRSLKNKTAFEADPCRSCSSFETFKGFQAAWDS